MKNKIQNSNSGFASLVLVLVVLVIAVGAFLYFVFGAKLSDKPGWLKLQPSPTVSIQTDGLEGELNSLEDTDPSNDFSEVDQDINSL